MEEAELLANPDLLKPLTKTKKSEQDLLELSKEELVDKIESLERHVQQLRNVIAKNAGSSLPQAKNKQQAIKFDFNRFKRRHVLLKVSYFGWDYMGFASQEDAGKSIESELFAALLQTKLIPSREEANYHRCGRTDRGVSATGQVISLDLRTALLQGEGVFCQDGYNGEEKGGKEEEIDYCTMLNRNLPAEIKVTGWAPAPRLDYSARFDCTSRTYHYYFPKANLDVDRMESAGDRLIGEHDFRNFCKMDVNNGVVQFVRRIDSIGINCMNRERDHERSGADDFVNSPYDMYRIVITAKAFLWHQIRCIVAVLFMVGEGKEDEEVITELLDVTKHPCRPAYTMAADLPLNLYSTQFDNINWRMTEYAREHVMKTTQEMWTKLSIKATMVREHLADVQGTNEVVSQTDCISGRRREKTYKPLLQLPVCPSLSEKIRTVAKRRKIDMEDEEGKLEAEAQGEEGTIEGEEGTGED